MTDKISSPHRSQDRARRRPPADSSLPYAGRRRGRFFDRMAIWGGLSLLLMGLKGCGLSGGSVPIGDGPKSSIFLQGGVVLPSGQPVAGATVVVRTLPSYQVVQTTTTDAAGIFAAANVPTGGDVEVVVSAAGGVTLKAVAPLVGSVTNPSPPTLNIGTVSLVSTVTAASIELEIAARPMDTATIVASQLAPLIATWQHLSEGGAGGGTGGSSPALTDNNFLQQIAKELIIETTNAEITTLNSRRDTADGSVALEGLLSYLNVAHDVVVVLSPAQKTQLIAAQIQGLTYTPTRVSLALQGAGSFRADVAGVQAVSAMERTSLPALFESGAEFSPFEALLIAVDSPNVGGFHLEPKALDSFLMQLLGK